MATRLYYRFDKYYFPTGQFTWDASSLSRSFVGGLDISKATIDYAFGNTAFSSSVNPSDILWMSFVSLPLTTQVISGTLKGQSRVSQSSTPTDLVSQMRVYLIDGTTGAIKSTLYSGYTGVLASEWSTTATNRKLPFGGSVALTSQTAAVGDRLLVMVGARTYSTSYQGMTMFLGSIAGPDLPEDETTTTGDAWLEFSGDLVFGTDFGVIDFMEFAENTSSVVDGQANRIGDPRAFWGEQTISGQVVVPEELQIWPRGNRE